MPHPKRRKSKSKKNKRRTHHNIYHPQFTICPFTEIVHLYHRAYWYEGKLFYRGKIIANYR